jgi:hypothetical protein
MSAEVVQAFQQEAHRLDAEADNAAITDQGGVEPMVKREIAQVLRNLALRSQGTDPAARAAEENLNDSSAGTSGLVVDKQDAPSQDSAPGVL